MWAIVKLQMVLALTFFATAHAQDHKTADPDRWLPQPLPPHSHPAQHQEKSQANQAVVNASLFSHLHAEVITERLKVYWKPDSKEEFESATLHFSAAHPAHWPVRFWQSIPMTRPADIWQGTLSVEDIDIAVVYYVSGKTKPTASHQTSFSSPLRVVLPRALGLKRPTRLFWPFLEGFETGSDSWQILFPVTTAPLLRLDPGARTGRKALAITVPSGKRMATATLATTRLRGWQLQREGATGIRLWVRTRQGKGSARFALVANSKTPNQTLSPWPDPIDVTPDWQQVNLPFDKLGDRALASVDRFTVDLIAPEPREFLLDDLQLTGPWSIVSSEKVNQ